MITKPHSQCTAEELMTAVSIEVQDGIATLRYAEDLVDVEAVKAEAEQQ
jgi:hypothetical protein